MTCYAISAAIRDKSRSANDNESAILITLNPGNYTAIVDSGTVGAAGIGIIEIYEIDAPEGPLVNISTRGRVLTGNSFLIGGFAISGAAKKVLIVARGSTVTAKDILPAERLANPRVTLVAMGGSSLPGGVGYISNDNWRDAPNDVSAITATGKAPANDNESAILVTLNPGHYTAIVDGGPSLGTGNGLGLGSRLRRALGQPVDSAHRVGLHSADGI